MKLIVFTMHFYPETFRINTVLKSLRNNNNCEIKVICGKPNYHGGFIPKKYNNLRIQKSKFYKVEVVRIPVFPRKKKKFWQIFLNYFSYLINTSLFVLFNYKKLKSDLIIVYATSPILQAIPALLLSKILNIKLILWLQDLWPDNLISSKKISNKFLINCLSFITKIIYKKSDLILIQSKAFKKKILDLVPNKKSIKYHPNPTEEINFSFPKYKPRFKKSINFFLIGNIGDAQSPQSIINLAKYLMSSGHEDSITIYGVGSGIEFIKKAIRKYKLNNLYLKKHISPKKLHLKLLDADMFLTCLKNGSGLSETIPARIQTYIFFGKSIISLDHLGELSKFISKNKIGYNLNTYDYKSLDKKFNKIRFHSKVNQKNVYNRCKKLYDSIYNPLSNSKKLLSLIK